MVELCIDLAFVVESSINVLGSGISLQMCLIIIRINLWVELLFDLKACQELVKYLIIIL